MSPSVLLALVTLVAPPKRAKATKTRLAALAMTSMESRSATACLRVRRP